MKGYYSVERSISTSRGKKINSLFFALLLIEVFCPASLAYSANVATLLYFLFKNKGRLLKPFHSMNYLYLIIGLGLLLGFTGLAIGRFETRDYVRDIYYFTNPIFIMLNGAYIKKTIKDDTLFFNTIIYAAGVQAVYYLAHAALIISSVGFSLSFRSWRSIFGDSSAIAATTVFLLLVEGKNELETINRQAKGIIMSLCIIEVVFSLSRTNTLLILITSICIGIQRGIFKNRKKWIKYLLLILVVVALSIGLLGKTEAVSTFVRKVSDSFTEINSALDWSTTAEIQSNWRGYETYCALTQFKTYPLIRQFIGYGFGERIEVGVYANLFLKITNSDGSAATTIPVLHNGYATMLCKLGLVGIILYLLFYISTIKMSQKHRYSHRFFAEILVAIVIAMGVETYILNGLFRETVNFPFIYMMGYLGYLLNHRERNYVVEK